MLTVTGVFQLHVMVERDSLEERRRLAGWLRDHLPGRPAVVALARGPVAARFEAVSLAEADQEARRVLQDCPVRCSTIETMEVDVDV